MFGPDEQRKPAEAVREIKIWPSPQMLLIIGN